MREKRSLVHRNVDATAVPGGPQGQFARQYVAQIDAIRAPLNDLLARVESLETAEPTATPVGYWPRKKITDALASPYAIPWTEVGYVYDDAGATADTGLLLPDPATYEGDVNGEAPWFRFRRGTSYTQRIIAQGDAVLHIDLADESAANGHVDLIEANSTLLLAMIDSGWVAFGYTGKLQVDA